MDRRFVAPSAPSKLSNARSRTPYARPASNGSQDENRECLIPETPGIFSLVKQYLTPTKWHLGSRSPFSSSSSSTTTSAAIENRNAARRAYGPKHQRRNGPSSDSSYPRIANIFTPGSKFTYPPYNPQALSSPPVSSPVGKTSFFTPLPSASLHESPNQKLAAFFQQKGDSPLSDIEQAGVIALINEANRSGTSLLSEGNGEEADTSFDMDSSFAATPSRLPRKTGDNHIVMSSPLRSRQSRDAAQVKNKPLANIPTPYRPGSSELSSTINNISFDSHDESSSNQSFSMPEKRPLSKTASTLLSIIDPIEEEDKEPLSKKAKNESVVPENLKNMVNPYFIKSSIPSKATSNKASNMKEIKTPTKPKSSSNHNNAKPPKNPLSDLEKTMPLEQKEGSNEGSPASLKLSASPSTDSSSPSAFVDKYKPTRSSKLRESINGENSKLGLFDSSSASIPEFKVSPEKSKAQTQDSESTDVSPSKPLYPSFSSLNNEKKSSTESTAPFSFSSSLSTPASSTPSFSFSSASAPLVSTEKASESVKATETPSKTDSNKPVSAPVFAFSKVAPSPFKLDSKLESESPAVKVAAAAPAPATFSFNFGGAKSSEENKVAVEKPVTAIEYTEEKSTTSATKPLFSFGSTTSTTITPASAAVTAAPVAMPSFSTSKPFTFGIKPVAEVKPVEVKPVEVKPVEVKPVETKPIEVKPVEVSKPVFAFSKTTPEVSLESNLDSTATKTDSDKYKDLFVFEVICNNNSKEEKDVALQRAEIDKYKSSTFLF